MSQHPEQNVRPRQTGSTLSPRGWGLVICAGAVMIGGLWPWLAFVAMMSRLSLQSLGGAGLFQHHWVLMLLIGILMPVAAGVTAALDELSRSRGGVIRLGSLSGQQFVQVLCWVIAGWFFVLLITGSGPAFGVHTMVLLIGMLGAVGMMICAVFPAVLGLLSAAASAVETPNLRDNADPAHSSDPADIGHPAPTADTPSDEASVPGISSAGDSEATHPDDIENQESETQQPAASAAFWFAVPTVRTTDPEEGSHQFTLHPGVWVLALEDRNEEFLVQSADGQTGVLRDLDGIERAPQQ